MKMVHYNKHIIVQYHQSQLITLMIILLKQWNHFFLFFFFFLRSFLQWLDCSKHFNILLVDYECCFCFFFSPLQLFSRLSSEFMNCFRNWNINHIQQTTACDCLSCHFLRVRLHRKWVNPQWSYDVCQTVDQSSHFPPFLLTFLLFFILGESFLFSTH